MNLSTGWGMRRQRYCRIFTGDVGAARSAIRREDVGLALLLLLLLLLHGWL
jgi:hypothetical protein